MSFSCLSSRTANIIILVKNVLYFQVYCRYSCIFAWKGIPNVTGHCSYPNKWGYAIWLILYIFAALTMSRNAGKRQFVLRTRVDPDMFYRSFMMLKLILGNEIIRAEDRGEGGGRQGVWPRQFPQENNRDGFCQGKGSDGNTQCPIERPYRI